MIRALALALVLAAASLAAAPPARAVGDRLDVAVVDRDSGETLAPIAYRGQWWVAGRPGARYGIVLTARDGRRLLGVVSVDGVNAISGDTAAWNQTGYVVDPYRSFRIDGWRKNAEQVAAFTFAALPDSYAARTGRPANVGVIGVAVFDERAPAAPPPPASEPGERLAPSARSLPLPAPKTPAPAAPDSDARAASSATARGEAAPPDSPLVARDRLGTGHGAIESSPIVDVAFERARTTPAEIVTIHYDRLENLVALGIVPRRPTPPAVDPFPGSRRYVPDPPSR